MSSRPRPLACFCPAPASDAARYAWASAMVEALVGRAPDPRLLDALAGVVEAPQHGVHPRAHVLVPARAQDEHVAGGVHEAEKNNHHRAEGPTACRMH